MLATSKVVHCSIPVTVYVALHSLREELVEFVSGEKLLFHGDKVMVHLVNVLVASLALELGDILSFEVDVLDELSLGGLVFFKLLIFVKRFRLENIEAVDFFLLPLGLVHADLIDLAAETTALRTHHSLKLARQQDLAIVSVAQLVDSEHYLGVTRQVKRVDFELRADGTLDSASNMQSKRHADHIAVLESLLDAWVSRVRHQVGGSLQLGQRLHSRYEGLVDDFFSHRKHFFLGHRPILLPIFAAILRCTYLRIGSRQFISPRTIGQKGGPFINLVREVRALVDPHRLSKEVFISFFDVAVAFFQRAQICFRKGHALRLERVIDGLVIAWELPSDHVAITVVLCWFAVPGLRAKVDNLDDLVHKDDDLLL